MKSWPRESWKSKNAKWPFSTNKSDQILTLMMVSQNTYKTNQMRTVLMVQVRTQLFQNAKLEFKLRMVEDELIQKMPLKVTDHTSPSNH